MSVKLVNNYLKETNDEMNLKRNAFYFAPECSDHQEYYGLLADVFSFAIISLPIYALHDSVCNRHRPGRDFPMISRFGDDVYLFTRAQSIELVRLNIPPEHTISKEE